MEIQGGRKKKKLGYIISTDQFPKEEKYSYTRLISWEFPGGQDTELPVQGV